MIEATEKQLGLLWHTLGLCTERSDRRSISRNHYLTSPGYDDSNNLDVLVAAGLMTRSKAPAFCSGDEVVYRATDEGKQFALDKLPPPPPPAKRTKFDAYLDECECYEASLTSSASTCRSTSSAAAVGSGSTGWFATPEGARTASIGATTTSSAGLSTNHSRLPASGLGP